MALVRSPPYELNPPSGNNISTDNTEQLVLLEKTKKEWPHQLSRPDREIYLILAKLAVVLIFAVSYLTFCFIVHHHNVPVGRSRDLGLPFPHFGTMSIITTMAILIVYVALWPMKGVIDEIRAEEFFRLMHTHPNGVPLDSVNAVSATTTGAFDILMATIHRHCSPLLTSTLVISLVITATSSIAPAALSAGSKWIDVNNSTLSIGAVPKDAILGDARNTQFPWALLPVALTMTWVENILNLTNCYYGVTSSEGDQSEYLVPFPIGYTSTMKAHWTTDVIILDPSCSWQTVTTEPPQPWGVDVTLPESNLGMSLGSADLVSTDNGAKYNTSRISAFVGTNNTSGSVPVDGSIIFVIDQLTYPSSESDGAHSMSVDLSNIPTLELPTGNILAFLVCSPHVSIQTHHIQATGNGNLTLGEPQQSPGNIDFYQANYLLSYIFRTFPTNSGPTTSQYQIGTDMMARFILGTDFQSALRDPPFATPPDHIPPAPLTNITAVYKQVAYSALKTFVSGRFVTENVPGSYSEEQIVFTSSLGHILISAILFLFLMSALVAAQFRKGRVAFTLVNVAAALADSDMLQKSVEMTLKAGTGERKVLKLVPGGDGQLYCVYEGID